MIANAVTSLTHNRTFVGSRVGSSIWSHMLQDRKKLVIAASLVGLAVFIFLAFGLIRTTRGARAHSDISNNAVEKPAATSQPTTSQQPIPNDSSVNVELHSSTSSSSNPPTNTSTSDLTINGQHVQTNGGNVDEHYTSPDGKTKVNISVQGHSSSGGSSQ